MNKKVKTQILAIRDTGAVNMFEFHSVQRLAYENEFYELVVFMEDNRKDYFEFILQGGT